jgi:hypothetical protein
MMKRKMDWMPPVRQKRSPERRGGVHAGGFHASDEVIERIPYTP